MKVSFLNESNKFNSKAFGDLLFAGLVLVTSMTAIVFLFGIILTLFQGGFEVFRKVGVLKFVFGLNWYPTYEPAEFGILPLIIGSLVVTVGALCLSIPLGVGSAIYISEMARPREKELLKPLLELLAGIPSVIYGLFGMAFLAPFIRHLFNLDTGLNALTASIILGVMVIPIVASMTEDALNSVPMALREASYALGASRWETIWQVVVPAARSGILSAVILGFGRAIGETMVVLMVAGNSAIIPHSIFDPVRPMPSAVAAEMGETAFGTLHFQALFGIAIVLFAITFVSNILTEIVRSRIVRKSGGGAR